MFRFFLYRGAMLVRIGTIHAAITRLRLEDYTTTGAFIEVHSKVVWHFFLFGESTFGTSNVCNVFEHWFFLQKKCPLQ